MENITNNNFESLFFYSNVSVGLRLKYSLRYKSKFPMEKMRLKDVACV